MLRSCLLQIRSTVLDRFVSQDTSILLPDDTRLPGSRTSTSMIPSKNSVQVGSIKPRLIIDLVDFVVLTLV